MTTQLPRIGIIVGSTRQGRFGDRPANWILDIARVRIDMSVELIDLRDYPLPMFDEAASPAWKPPAHPVAQRWGARLAALDGLIVVTPEYNHGYPAVLKNAFDHAYAEFVRKPIGFVGYGAAGAARSVEQLRMVAIELQMAPVRNAVHIGAIEFMGMWQQGKTFDDFPYLAQYAVSLLDDIAWWARSLRAARDVRAKVEAA
jgi:NAD(P)H-dependent FMN reductase